MALLLQLLILVQVILHLVHLTLILLALGMLAVLVMVLSILVFVMMEDSLEKTLVIVLLDGIRLLGVRLCDDQSQEPTRYTFDWKHSLSAMMFNVLISRVHRNLLIRWYVFG